MCFRLHLLLADSPPLPAESSSSSCGPPIRLRLLSTPPRGDAVSFNYGGLAFPDMDFHHVMSAPSRAHWERPPGRDKNLPLGGNRGDESIEITFTASTTAGENSHKKGGSSEFA